MTSNGARLRDSENLEPSACYGGDHAIETHPDRTRSFNLYSFTWCQSDRLPSNLKWFGKFSLDCFHVSASNFRLVFSSPGNTTIHNLKPSQLCTAPSPIQRQTPSTPLVQMRVPAADLVSECPRSKSKTSKWLFQRGEVSNSNTGPTKSHLEIIKHEKEHIENA